MREAGPLQQLRIFMISLHFSVKDLCLTLTLSPSSHFSTTYQILVLLGSHTVIFTMQISLLLSLRQYHVLMTINWE
ncbi:hypothetical protein BDV12DRAFT_160637 [Aspergillus spectabilis]